MMFKTVKPLLKLVLWLARIVIKVALLLLEAGFWLVALVWGLFVKTSDAAEAAASVKEGLLRCPRGHAVPLSDGIYECAQCGYVYEGSILRCGNPECQATTPYVNCPECGLSVRSPYRWGRP